MEIKRLGVLGCGQMGSGIVQIFAQSGYQVAAVDADGQMLERAVKSIDNRMAGRVEKGKLDQVEKDSIMGRIATSTKMEDLKDCDLIEEAVFEDLELKKSWACTSTTLLLLCDF